ncbi:MAG: hypothetical protein IPG05_04430 [Gemmatimonadetes bacterium]|nr:hypothetical protein [Gemmatimonadota bacterium]
MATKIVLAPGGGIHWPGLASLALEAPIRVPTRLLALSLLLLAPGVATAQRLDWRARVALYGDNTEFFTPYRVGETILGTQLQTWLEAKPGRRTELRLGFYADRRLGSEQFTDTLLPIVAFRYRTEHSQGIIGTLETVRRHGLLEPLMVTTRELTTPVESGIQWIETRGIFRGEAGSTGSSSTRRRSARRSRWAPCCASSRPTGPPSRRSISGHTAVDSSTTPVCR